MQVKFIISAIDAALRSSPLHGLPHVSDSSDGVVEIQFLSHTDPVQWHGVESLHARGWIGITFNFEFLI
jgi:hypothetical protein